MSKTVEELEKENAELKSVLQNCYNDAGMALDGSWDKSDEGFMDVMENIELVFPEVKPYGTDS